jgi:putative spermidine/putrescine transport system ATP-binding protein
MRSTTTQMAPVAAGVSIQELTVRYGTAQVVHGISLDIAPGEFLSLLGPSGSGKTTTMMSIAGFVEDMSGRILVNGQRIDALPPHKRDVGVVFQQLALFPHMSVADNIAFPLRLRGVGKADMHRRVADALDLVHMSGFGERLPSQLSGGQQQRVAFARAIIFNPKVLLLDEPLAALDKKLRENMQRELRLLHERLGITIVHVTHDQIEAMAVSDRIVVMHDGRIAQSGTPDELYNAPANAFVADFIGESTFLQGQVTEVIGSGGVVTTIGGVACRIASLPSIGIGRRVQLMLRPENIVLGAAGEALPNACTGTVREMTFQGDRLRCEVALNALEALSVSLPNGTVRHDVQLGQVVTVGWQPAAMCCFEAA